MIVFGHKQLDSKWRVETGHQMIRIKMRIIKPSPKKEQHKQRDTNSKLKISHGK